MLIGIKQISVSSAGRGQHLDVARPQGRSRVVNNSSYSVATCRQHNGIFSRL